MNTPRKAILEARDQLLLDAINLMGAPGLATALGTTTRTIARWKSGDTPLPGYLDRALTSILTPPFPSPKNPDFTFIDLFAGIGGLRTAFQAHNGGCVLSSEWDKFAEKTYKINYGNESHFIGDIHERGEVPEHDILLAGFPCQPFSLAGVSKKNSLGRPHGFDDPTQGTLFFEIKEILASKRPYGFVLENVKNLRSHDKGQTFQVIQETLEKELGYHVHYKIINGSHFTPQNRERIVIVGFRDEVDFSWDDLNLEDPQAHTLSKILHATDGSEPVLAHDGDRFFDHESQSVKPKYTLTDNLWLYLQTYAAKHKAAGNGFGFGINSPEDRARTLSARYHKDGSEILIAQSDANPRRLTPRECARLMGYDDSFIIPVSDTQAYKQFGNSVVAPLFQEVARIMLPHVHDLKRRNRQFDFVAS